MQILGGVGGQGSGKDKSVMRKGKKYDPINRQISGFICFILLFSFYHFHFINWLLSGNGWAGNGEN
ncbi:MAG TPA: hypothetical protein DDW50_22245 [Firmicutes bacterium]|jgi:hypothetical protein|nr:hypothetical protein [Bacillota bacterium]